MGRPVLAAQRRSKSKAQRRTSPPSCARRCAPVCESEDTRANVSNGTALCPDASLATMARKWVVKIGALDRAMSACAGLALALLAVAHATEIALCATVLAQTTPAAPTAESRARRKRTARATRTLANTRRIDLNAKSKPQVKLPTTTGANRAQTARAKTDAKVRDGANTTADADVGKD